MLLFHRQSSRLLDLLEVQLATYLRENRAGAEYRGRLRLHQMRVPDGVILILMYHDQHHQVQARCSNGVGRTRTALGDVPTRVALHGRPSVGVATCESTTNGTLSPCSAVIKDVPRRPKGASRARKIVPGTRRSTTRRLCANGRVAIACSVELTIW
jgi:hypothetical protein